MIESYRYHFRHICRPVFRFGPHFIFGVVLLGGALGCLQEHNVALMFPVAAIFVGVYWFMLRPFERRWTIRRQYAKQPHRDMDIEWQIASDTLVSKSPLGYSEFRWEAIMKVVRTVSGLMLYPFDNVWYFLPRRGFASDSEFEQTTELAKSKVREFYCV